ncbi:MAG: pyridoxal-phosphate dependent enzyme [Bacteroidetes bacterium]|nr:pyridoxal-phosphate dependent enzyme [Bacteroidota bacterium]
MIKYEPIINKIQFQNLDIEVLRLDLIDPEISGNKWFKLKKNLRKARQDEQKTVVTFGGAFSNHIAATAAACKVARLNSIGVIRGEQTEILNSTLQTAKEKGMQLYFVDRETYAKKETVEFKKHLSNKFGPHYLIPEGGNNKEGVLGCMEILKPEWDHDYVFCACGTATTYAGLVASAKPGQKVIGISVLKGENVLVDDAKKQLKNCFPEQEFTINGNEELQNESVEDNCISNNYSFNGYAKMDPELISFKKEFEDDFNIPLDHIYTNKLVYAVFDLIKKKKVKMNSKIMLVHSGGLQGNKGFEERYKIM